jgi:low affinity Fe/Cu permease
MTGGNDGWFRGFAERSATALGAPSAFLIALGFVVIWALSRSFFHDSQAWQIVINTGTTIITFLMVFLLQNTQARDSQAIHLKLNELLRSIAEARNDLFAAETLPDARLDQLRQEYATLAKEHASEGDAASGSATPTENPL